MKLSTRRLLLVSVVVTAVAFLTAGLLGNDRAGTLEMIADTAWIVFMVGMLFVLVLAVTVLIQGTLRRMRHRESV